MLLGGRVSDSIRSVPPAVGRTIRKNSSSALKNPNTASASPVQASRTALIASSRPVSAVRSSRMHFQPPLLWTTATA